MPRALNNISKNEQDPINNNGDINVGSAEKGYRSERECRRVRAGDDFPSPRLPLAPLATEWRAAPVPRAGSRRDFRSHGKHSHA